MRPILLNPLFAGAASLKGIGAKLDRLLAGFLRPNAPPGAEETRIVDLLFHLPSGVVDRRFRPRIADLPREGVVTVEARVIRHRPPPAHNKRVPYRVEVSDGTGLLSLVFFHAYADSLKRLLPEGETRFISGRIDWFNDEPQMAHPDHVVAADAFERMPLIEPVYPLTEGLSPKVLTKRSRARSNACRFSRNGRTRPSCSATTGRISAWRCASSTILKRPPRWDRTRRRGAGSPMTSCWPISWRSPWCAPA